MEHIRNAANSIVQSSKVQTAKDYIQLSHVREENSYETYKNEGKFDENDEPTFRKKESFYSSKRDFKIR